MPTRNTYGVLLVFIAAALLFGGLSVAYQNAGYQHTRTDHAVTVDYDQPTTLGPDRATGYSSSINVTVDGSQLEAGTDYAWNASNGTITWQNTTATQGGEMALVDYTYEAVSKQTQDRQRVLSPVVKLAPWFAVPVAIAATFKLAEGGW